MQQARPIRPVTTPDNREPRTSVYGQVAVNIRLLSGEQIETQGWVKNLNTRGMFTWCSLPLPDEAPCEFSLEMLHDNTSVSGRGWVVYSDEIGMAIQFDDFHPDEMLTLGGFLARAIGEQS